MRFKAMLAAVAAVAALSAAPAFAETVNSGYVGLSAANLDSDDFDVQEYALEGAVAFPITGNWGIQLDAEAAHFDADDVDGDSLTGTVHGFHRTASHLIGAFIGVSDTEDTTAYGGGVEGDLYLTNWTLSAQATYATDDSDVDIDSWSLEARGQYFISDSFTVGGGVGYNEVSVDVPGFDDSSTYYVGVDTEYQLSTAPISFFGGATYAEPDEGEESTGVQIGVRWNWNTANLRDRDRTGASLTGFGRALSGVM